MAFHNHKHAHATKAFAKTNSRYLEEGGRPMKKDADSDYQDVVARGNMYRFLSTIYLQAPTQELVLKVIDAEFLEELASLYSASSVAELDTYAGSADLERELALIKQDHMDLFAVPAGRYVTPFEDVYRGTRMDGNQERGPLLGVQAITVKIMYRMAGAEVDRTCKELPTHIGVELAFMTFLCDSEAVAMGSDQGTAQPDAETSSPPDPSLFRQLQRRFLKEHLNDWFPQLNQAIQAKANTHFYRGLGQVTEEFIARDTASLTSRNISEQRARVIQCGSAFPQPG